MACPMHPSLSLCLSHTVTHSECAEVMQLQVSTYLHGCIIPLTISHVHIHCGLQYLSRGIQQRMNQWRRRGKKEGHAYVQHHMHIPLSFVPFFGIQWGKLLYIFIYIYLCFWVIKWKILDEQNESKIYNLLENSASSIWQLRRLQNRLCILKQRRCKILGSCILLRVLEKKWSVDVDIPYMLGSWHCPQRLYILRIYHSLDTPVFLLLPNKQGTRHQVSSRSKACTNPTTNNPRPITSTTPGVANC